MDLERRFTLYFFAWIAAGCLAYFLLEPGSTGLLATIALIGVLGAIASAVLHFMLFKPIKQLAVMAKAVGSGDYSKRLGFERQDEIGRLALEMDTMCDQLLAAQVAAEVHIGALEQLRHSDRIATLGRLASSVAHELGNPLNVIELRAQLINSEDMGSLADAQQNAQIILAQTKRMTRIIDEILSFARMQPAKITRLDLVAVVRQAITLSMHTSRRHRANIVFDAPSAQVEIDGDFDKLLQIFVNLVMNGVQAMPHGGRLDVSIRSERCAPIDDPEGPHKDYACIHVDDRGIGISEAALSKVFEPFFSTKSAEGGTGLGLSVAQGIAREHDGWISVTSALGKGASFVVHLPKVARTAEGSHGR